MLTRNFLLFVTAILISSCQKEMRDWDLAQLPTVEISAVTVNPNEIRVSYEIISESPLKDFTIYWGENENPVLNGTSRTVDVGNKIGEISFSGLCEESLYYFKAIVKNEIGSNLSNETNRNTLAITPEFIPALAFEADVTEVFPGESVSFTNFSSNVGCNENWEWYVNDSLFSTDFNSTLYMDRTGVFSITLLHERTDGLIFELTLENYIIANASNYPEGAVSCINSPPMVFLVLSALTGKLWMDRNIGASQPAISATDELSLGDLYQWGRFSDGHQCRSSLTISTQASNLQPGHSSFIAIGNINWLFETNNDLWQGVNGLNNPCPDGFRLPTEAEWNEERSGWISDNTAGAFNSPLLLPASGFRSTSNGTIFNVGTHGYYWSSTISGSNTRYVFFNDIGAGISTNYRATGYSVRCIKE